MKNTIRTALVIST